MFCMCLHSFHLSTTFFILNTVYCMKYSPRTDLLTALCYHSLISSESIRNVSELHIQKEQLTTCFTHQCFLSIPHRLSLCHSMSTHHSCSLTIFPFPFQLQPVFLSRKLVCLSTCLPPFFAPYSFSGCNSVHLCQSIWQLKVSAFCLFVTGESRCRRACKRA